MPVVETLVYAALILGTILILASIVAMYRDK
jgi:hypothetical protein